MEAEDSEESVPEAKTPKKSRLGFVLAIVAVTVLVTGAAVAGTVFGPALLGHPKKAEAAEKKAKEKEKIGESVELQPIMVDARADDGALHHIKVVLAVEVAEGTPKDEFMRFVPRGREAAVGFLRSQSFDHLVAAANYAEVRADLSKQFTDAIGHERVSRVLVTDFVAQ